jgi:hypothetical protein
VNTDQLLFSNQDTQSDELEQVHFTSEEQIIVKGNALSEFEFGASMRLRSMEEALAFGIVFQYAATERLQAQFIKSNDSWKLAVTSEGIAPVINHVLSLPNGFRAEQWHTLSMVQREEQIQLYLDEEHVLVISEATRTAQPGLLVHNAAVDFAGIWQKELHS